MPNDGRRNPAAAKTAAKSTVAGPRKRSRRAGNDPAARKMEGTQALAAAFPFNPNKPAEFGEAASQGQAGRDGGAARPGGDRQHADRGDDPSAKAGEPARPGVNPGNAPLDRVRVDSGGQVLTTNFGQPIADNQNSLKAGLRGPALLEDFILREKITHFDHERIPERIVHARGSAAHGFFECYESMARYTRASFLSEKGKRTPVFVRFSTVAGERGSTDTPRDVRGLRHEVLHRRGQLRHRRQQHPGLLHPGRHEVPGPGARAEAGAAPRHAPGGQRPRHLLGLRLAHAGDPPTC